MVLCLLLTAAAGVVLFVAAWVIGGRSGSSAPLADSVLPPEEEMLSAEESLSHPPGYSGVEPVVGAQEDFVAEEGPAILPGAIDSFAIHQIPVEQLSLLKPLGWNVAHLQGYGLQPRYAETGIIDDVRTVQVQLSDGENFVNVSETRSEGEGIELAPLEEKLANVLDVEAVEHQQIQLSTGDVGDVFFSDEGEQWTAAVETGNAQYVITSDMTEVSASQLTAWVLVTDRSRLQTLPTEEPGGLERIERGLQEIFDW